MGVSCLRPAAAIAFGLSFFATSLTIQQTVLASVAIGSLDIDNNKGLVIEYAGSVGTLLSDVTTAIASGRNGVDSNDQANWNGPGIITSAGRAANVALGFDAYNVGAADNADFGVVGIGPPIAEFAGQPVTPNSVLVKYTYSGDADLNGVVDADDYSYWLNGFLGSTSAEVKGWLRGDFNHDGVVDADDYTQWLNAFLLHGPPLVTTGATVLVAAPGQPDQIPEPVSLLIWSLLGSLGIACAWRRRRRKD